MKALTIIAVAMLAPLAFGDVTATKVDGGSMATELNYGIAVNKDSTMRREWVAIHDTELPVDLVGTPGVITVYKSGSGRYSSGKYQYNAAYTISAKEPIVAIQVNFICFDVWGQRTKTLSATDVQDFGVGEHSLDGAWQLFSENEVSEHYASISYIARVRTKSGEIYAADTDEVVDVAREYMDDFTDDLLETDPPPKN